VHAERSLGAPSPTEAAGKEANRTALGLLALVLAPAWGLLFVYALHGAMSFNPIQLVGERELRVFMPQGWAFFTRDAREEDLLPFARRRGAWASASIGPHARRSNLFGLSRTGRAQGIEAGLLLKEIPETAWSPCRAAPADCFENLPSAGPFRNISPRPTLCGDLGLALQKPIPWAWSASRRKPLIPSRVVRLSVSC